MQGSPGAKQNCSASYSRGTFSVGQIFPNENLEVFGDDERGACHQLDGGMLPGFEARVKAVIVKGMHHDLGSEANMTRVRFTEACA